MVRPRRDAPEVTTVVVEIADNLWLVVVQSIGGAVDLTTHPVELGRFDEATAILVAHEINGGAGPGDRSLAYACQTSLDGIHWVIEGPSDTVNAASATPALATGAVHGRFLRFLLHFEVTVASPGAANFDLDVRLRKS